MNFASKAKKERVRAAATDVQEPCKKIKIPPTVPIPRVPLPMMRRSADVALYSSTTVLLLPEPSKQGPSDAALVTAPTTTVATTASSSSSSSSTLSSSSSSSSSSFIPSSAPTAAVHGGGRRGLGTAVDCTATHTTSRPSAVKEILTRRESSSERDDDDGDSDDGDGDSDSDGDGDDGDDYGGGGRGGAHSGSESDGNDRSSDAGSMRHTKPKIINSTSTSTSTSSVTPGTPRGIVTMKSSDAILCHILRHVEKSMVILGKNIMKNKSGNENNQKNENGNGNSAGNSRTRKALSTYCDITDKVPNENLSAVPSQSCKESSVEHSSIDLKNKGDVVNHLARQICRCIFVLFTETPALSIASNIINPLSPGIRDRNPRIANRINSNTAHSIEFLGHRNSQKLNSTVSTMSTVSTGGLKGIRYDDDSSSLEILDSGFDARNVPKKNILLRNISDRRRCQALSMATKYISHCNKDCLRLLKDISAAYKARNILSSSTHPTSTRHDGGKRRRSEDDVWGDSFGMRGKGKGKSKKRGYGFSDSEDEDQEVVLETEASDTKEKEKEKEQEKDKESVCDADDDDSDIEVHHTLIPAAASAPPPMFVQPKGNVPYVSCAVHTPYSFLEALLAVTKPSSVLGAKEWFFNKTPHEQKRTAGNSKNSDPSSSTSSKQNFNPYSNSTKSENENENEKKTPGNNSSSDKHAHSLIFKIEEVEWRLLQLIRELDKQRQVLSNGKRKVR